MDLQRARLAVRRQAGSRAPGRIGVVDDHGGRLDRLDSVIFAAPLLVPVVRYWWTV